MTYIKNISQNNNASGTNLRKDLSEKALTKLQNLTPNRKRSNKTPTNAYNNKTAGKSINSKIRSVLAVTPKKG